MYCGKKISVAMAAYNGEKFIQEQLNSILEQTVLPDEVVVSDDGSADRTIEFLTAYEIKFREAGVYFRLERNSGDHGYRGNFQNALDHVTGDYIFLCDQDDFWYPDKLKSLADEFDTHPEAELICHDAVVTDADGKAIQAVFADAFPRELFNHRAGNLLLFEQESFWGKSILRTFPGMVMCFTRKFLESISPFPNIKGHDSWLFFCAVSNNTAYYFPEQLGIYRVHGANTSNPLNQKDDFFRTVMKIGKMLSRPTSYSKDLFIQSNAMLEYLEKKGIKEGPGYSEALRLLKFETRLRSAEIQSRLPAAVSLLRLYRTESFYQSGGKKQLIAHLCNVLLHSKKARIACAEI